MLTFQKTKVILNPKQKKDEFVTMLLAGMILTAECALIDIKEESAGRNPMGGEIPEMM